MISNQGSFLPLQIFSKNTMQVTRKDPWVVRCSRIFVWIGRGDIVSHLLGVKETNSRLVYNTHTRVISIVTP